MRQKSPARRQRHSSAGSPKRPPGRPRSEPARVAILRSTLKLLGQNGFSDLTIEAVAAHANVGKATVYRWWPNKAALITDAFASSTGRKLNFPDTGSVFTDMNQQMRQVVKIFRSPRGRILSAILAAGQSDKDVIARFPRTLHEAAPPGSLRDDSTRNSTRRTARQCRPRRTSRFTLRPHLHAISNPPRQAHDQLRRQSVQTSLGRSSSLGTLCDSPKAIRKSTARPPRSRETAKECKISSFAHGWVWLGFRKMLPRYPLRVRSEQAVHKADLVGNEKTKAKTKKSRS